MMGLNGPPVPMKTRSQLEVEVSPVQCSQRWENLGFIFPRHWPARGPPGISWIKPLARELQAKSSVLIDASVTASRWFYQLVEFVFWESSFPGMKQTQSLIIHHLSSVWERWYDLFTCNEAWPYRSRDFLKRGMCQLTDLSHEWNHKQIFSSPPSSLPPHHFFSDHLRDMLPLPGRLQVAYLGVNSETSNYKGHPDNWPVFQSICPLCCCQIPS